MLGTNTLLSPSHATNTTFAAWLLNAQLQAAAAAPSCRSPAPCCCWPVAACQLPPCRDCCAAPATHCQQTQPRTLLLCFEKSSSSSIAASLASVPTDSPPAAHVPEASTLPPMASTSRTSRRWVRFLVVLKAMYSSRCEAPAEEGRRQRGRQCGEGSVHHSSSQGSSSGGGANMVQQ